MNHAAKAATVTFKVNTRDLLPALTRITAFAGDDDTLPMLRAVRFNLRPGKLYLSATDRYVLGQLRVDIDSDITADFIVPTPELARLARYFRPVGRTSRPVLSIEVTDKALIVEESGVIPHMPGVRAAIGLYDGKVPPMDSLFDLKPVTEAYMSAFNPVYMARFAKAQQGGEPMVLTPMGADKPTFVTVGAHFRGLIMPVRIPESRNEAGDAWPKLDAPKPQEPAAKAPARRPRKKAVA